MSEHNAPWSALEDGPPNFLSGLRKHWPHYITATLYFSATWSFERDVEFEAVYEFTEGDPPEGHIECAATTRTDTWTASASDTFTWDRMTSADEIYEATPADNEFYGDLRTTNSSLASLDHSFEFGESGTTTGSISQTIHGGDACEVTSTTTTGTITLSGHPGLLAILETALATWKKSRTNTGGNEPIVVESATGPGLPESLPTQPNQLTLLAGPPEGADITFGYSETTTIPDTGGWHGTVHLSYTLTLTT